MGNTQSSRIPNDEIESNNAISTHPIQSKTSKRKIYNNIKEKLFQAEIYTYKDKQKLLLDNIKKMIKVYNKCIKMSKERSWPKSKCFDFEDIELVVARIVDEAFGLRAQAHERIDETIVGREVNDKVLKSIAERLLTLNNTKILQTKTDKTQSLRIPNGEKESNNAISTHPIQSKTSKRKIYNNIKEKLFQAEICNYKDKQKLLLDNIKKMIKVYNKCIKMSKERSWPKSKCFDFEDIELVVARIVDVAFGLRAQADERIHEETIEEADERIDEETIEGRDAEELTVLMLRVGDIRVWDKQSPDDEALTSIAERLLMVHGRLRAETLRLVADRQQLRCLITQLASGTGSPVDELGRALDGDLHATGVSTADSQKRYLVEIMERVRDALAANREHRSPVARNSCCGQRLHSLMAAQEFRELRTRLAVVQDKLMAAEKDKRDLLDIVEKSRSDPTMVESLRAGLSKEREKNNHLQSVVDDMFIAVSRNA